MAKRKPKVSKKGWQRPATSGRRKSADQRPGTVPGSQVHGHQGQDKTRHDRRADAEALRAEEQEYRVDSAINDHDDADDIIFVPYDDDCDGDWS